MILRADEVRVGDQTKNGSIVEDVHVFTNGTIGILLKGSRFPAMYQPHEEVALKDIHPAEAALKVVDIWLTTSTLMSKDEGSSQRGHVRNRGDEVRRTPQLLLEAAADYLEKADETECAYTAIHAVAETQSPWGKEMRDAVRLLADHLGIDSPTPNSDLFDWNDDHTRQTVVYAMRAAAQGPEEEGTDHDSR